MIRQVIIIIIKLIHTLFAIPYYEVMRLDMFDELFSDKGKTSD